MTYPAGLPPLHLAQVYIDFDGTLCAHDVIDELIRAYAVDGTWALAERDWQAGRIGSRECLERQLGLVRIAPAELQAFVARLGLDEGAVELVRFLWSHSVPVAVLSDGLDLIIRPTLAKFGLGELTVRSNSAAHAASTLSLDFPHASAQCKSAAAHCKCASARQLLRPGRRTIYIGDGRSDLCPARGADFVFAKKALADLLAAEDRSFQRYHHLSDVLRTLRAAWKQEHVRVVAEAGAAGSPG